MHRTRSFSCLFVIAGSLLAACSSSNSASGPEAPATTDAQADTTDAFTVNLPDVMVAPPDDRAAPEDHFVPEDRAELADIPSEIDAGVTPPQDVVVTRLDVPPVTDVPRDVTPDAGTCALPPACTGGTLPTFSARRWVHSIESNLTVITGGARHRGRDLFVREGAPQWALAKFAYGATDKDLEDEDIEIFVQRNCAGPWERLGTARTTRDSTGHPTTEGVADTGGWVFFQIPAAMRLGVGRHRLVFGVVGDHTTAEQLIEVIPPEARVVVTDVDGTLTESENAEFAVLFSGPSPQVNAGGPEMLTALARRGYRIFYLTARPEWLEARTHAWLRERGLPPGLVHTTLTFTGALSTAAVSFKTGELNDLILRFGRRPDYAFGNTDSDVTAYRNAAINAPDTYYYRYTGDTRGGVRVDDYRTLVAGFSAGPLYCR